MYEEDPSCMRTIDNYCADVLNENVCETGVYKESILNQIVFMLLRTFVLI